MSAQEKIEIKCPECGDKSKITVWQSINVSIDTEMKEELMHGHVNVFHCPNCGYHDPLPVPFLYHDMDRGFCVQYYPVNELDDDSFFGNFTPNGKIALDPKEFPDELIPDYMKDTHIVFNMMELVQYVFFRDKLDAFFVQA